MATQRRRSERAIKPIELQVICEPTLVTHNDPQLEPRYLIGDRPDQSDGSCRAKVAVTIVVLTQDEESNLPSCLRSVLAISDDCHVLDSGSSDRTIEIARAMGATVHFNPFTGFGDQRNWAIDHIPHRYDWVLHLDADERLTDEFVIELAEIIRSMPDTAGFFVPNKLMFGKKWLKYSSGYPIYQVRLFHRQRLRFENRGHGQAEVTTGKIGRMQQPYLHYAFSKGLENWFVKHAKYAKAEALAAKAERTSILSEMKSLFFGPQIERRRALKRISWRLPCRGFLRQFELLILRRGLLDGRSGLIYAKMIAAYETMTAVFIASGHSNQPASSLHVEGKPAQDVCSAKSIPTEYSVEKQKSGKT